MTYRDTFPRGAPLLFLTSTAQSASNKGPLPQHIPVMPSPPTPHHILRTHSSPLSSLSFSPTNTHLYASDQDGNLSITDLRSLRSTSHWKAHDGGALGIQEWAGGTIRYIPSLLFIQIPAKVIKLVMVVTTNPTYMNRQVLSLPSQQPVRVGNIQLYVHPSM
jgi:WD40 repeat protein